MKKQKRTQLVLLSGCLLSGFLAGIAFDAMILQKQNRIREYTVQDSSPDISKPVMAPNNLILHYNQMVKNDPGNSGAWVKLGHLYFDSNQYIKAIAAYNKYLSLEPGNADVWTDLGVMYRRNGEPEKAIRSFDSAMRVNPRHEPSRFNKGIVLLYDLKQPSAAVESWKELLKINPGALSSNGTPVKDLVAQLEISIKKR